MRLAALIATAAVLAGTAPGYAASGKDLLDTPARPSALAERRLITSIARGGDQAVVAVGQRGHALRSTDNGKSWSQASVPVSSDLTAVQFVDSRVGYAVGHDGVVLRTADGGATWSRVLDGRTANKLLHKHYRRALWDRTKRSG